MFLFEARQDAGRKLAALLQKYRGEEPLVLGLPRGGVPVAFEVAQALGAAMDMWAIGSWYEDFSQVSDDEVAELLRRGSFKPPGDQSRGLASSSAAQPLSTSRGTSRAAETSTYRSALRAPSESTAFEPLCSQTINPEPGMPGLQLRTRWKPLMSAYYQRATLEESGQDAFEGLTLQPFVKVGADQVTAQNHAKHQVRQIEPHVLFA